MTLTACRADGRVTAPRLPGRRAVETTTSTTALVLAPAVPYVVPAGEVVPEVKQPAATALQQILRYGPGGGTPDAARGRLAGAPVLPTVADRVAALLRPDGSGEADIVYPQLAGLTPTQAAVMVVTRLRVLEGGVRDTVTRTIDVRLEKRNGVWTVIDIPSIGGDPVAPPATLSPAARRVLDHPQIDLPDSSRWDIYAGRIDDRVLTELANVADKAPVAVVVMKSGHPTEVFGSSRVSNHIRGRGVDVWKIGAPVVDQRAADGPLRPIVDQLLREGVTELGAPFDVDGAGKASFADVVHQDHLHIAFDA